MENQNLELEKLTIYELRRLARDVGVKAPTTKHHKELIDSVKKILSGEQEAYSSNRGRPPKNVAFANNTINFEKNDGENVKYTFSQENGNNLFFCATDDIRGINKMYVPCKGILREVDDNKYIYNHMEAVKFITVSQQLCEKYKLNIGDYVVGKAVETSIKTGYLEDVEDINFDKVDTSKIAKKPNEIRELISNDDLISAIKKDKQPIKVALELETKDEQVVDLRNDCIYFYSNELDNIQKSYNAVLDMYYLVLSLCKKGKKFTLYLIDIDYIFIILNMHLKSLQSNPDREFVDAGHFLKTIFSCINNSKNSNIIVYENKKYKRNEYLDAILNKYL